MLELEIWISTFPKPNICEWPYCKTSCIVQM